MHVKFLEVRNFKSIRNLKLECRKVNLFIGEPNAGKSNILETIGLASHLTYGQLREFVRFELMRDLFYDQILEEPIQLRFDEKTLEISYKDGRFIARLLNMPGDFPEIFNYEYHGNGNKSFMGYGTTETATVRTYFGYFKSYRYTSRDSFPLQTSEFLYPPHGDNLLAVLMSRKQLLSIMKEMFAKFGYRPVFRPHEGKIEVQKEFKDVLVSFPYSLSSETLQRVVFYLAAMYSNRDSILTFEEPEAHAFPYYMKYLAERIARDKNGNQYFIATHNPYFLTSILEKTPKHEVAAFITYLHDYQTKVVSLKEKQKEEILEMGIDAFFNIDRFLSKKD